MAGRIQQHLERLQHWRVEMTDDSSRKRLAPTDMRGDTGFAKRPRFANGIEDGLDVSQFNPKLPLPLSQLFTLTVDESCKSFDVQAIPVDVVVKILVPMLNSLESVQIDTAINVCPSSSLYWAIGALRQRRRSLCTKRKRFLIKMLTLLSIANMLLIGHQSQISKAWKIGAGTARTGLKLVATFVWRRGRRRGL